MKAPYSTLPAVPYAVGFAAGILLYGAGVPWYWLIAAMLAAVLMFVKGLAYYAPAMLAVVMGWAISSAAAPAPLPPGLHGREATISGVIKKVEEYGDWNRLQVDVAEIDGQKLGSHMQMWVFAPAEPDVALRGTRLKARGMIGDIRSDLRLPYEADFSRYSLVAGVMGSMTLHDNSIEYFPPQEPGWGHLIDEMQQRMSLVFYASGLEVETADFLSATVCGLGDYMSDDNVAEYRSLGLVHLLALSGFHVGIFAALVGFVILPLGLWRKWARLKYLIMALMVWLYVAVTGMQDSAVRAATMLTVLMGARLLQERTTPLNTLAVSALLMMAVNPFVLYSAGFQFSFAAVFALLTMAEPLNPFSYRSPKAHWVASLVTVPVAAVTGTAVLSLAYYHSFPLLFLPANIVACVIATPLIFCGLLMCILGLCGVGCAPLEWVINLLHNMLQRWCSWLSGSIPQTQISGLYFSGPVLLLMAVAVLALAVAMSARRRAGYYVAAASLMMAIAGQRLMAEAPVGGEMYMPSGLGDSRVILRHDTVAAVYSDASAGSMPGVLSDCRRRYSGWLELNRCGSDLTPVDSLPRGATALCRRSNLLMAGPYTVLLLDGSPNDMHVDADYVLITGRGHRRSPDFRRIAAEARPIAVILGRRLEYGSRRRFADSCRRYGLRCHNLADSAFMVRF